MKASEIFQGKSLKAEDIKGKNPVVYINKVELKTFDDNTTKPIISFTTKGGVPLSKSLVCNRTNWNAIVDITGQDDSDRWTGKAVKLIVARVDFQGKRVDAIRVEDPAYVERGSVSRPSGRDYTEQLEREPGDDTPPPTDDDIPF